MCETDPGPHPRSAAKTRESRSPDQRVAAACGGRPVPWQAWQPCPLQFGQGRLKSTGRSSPNQAPQRMQTGARASRCTSSSRRTPPPALQARSLPGALPAVGPGLSPVPQCECEHRYRAASPASSPLPCQAFPSTQIRSVPKRSASACQQRAVAALDSVHQRRRDAHRPCPASSARRSRISSSV